VAKTKEKVQELKASLEVIEAAAAQIGATVCMSFEPDDEPELAVWYQRAKAGDIQEQQREDLAWLKTHLEDNVPEQWRLRGCFIAVMKSQIRAAGPSEKLTRMQLRHRLGAYLASCAVVVPVQVPGSDAEEYWLDLQRELNLDIHPG